MGRSDNYQYKIMEIAVDSNVLNNFSNEDGIGSFFGENSSTEELLEYQHQLMVEIMHIIDHDLTIRQRQVLKLRLLGKTQSEIGKQLDIHQTTVHKIEKGNIDYNNDKKVYGGAIKKIKKLCAKSPKIQLILGKIHDAQMVE